VIGLALLWMMGDEISSNNKRIDEKKNQRTKRRAFDRVVGLLKQYGEIPETALVETEFVRMEIHAVTGEVDGEILAGQYKGRRLTSLEDEIVINLVNSSSDTDTKELLESYLAFLEKARSKED